MGSVFRRQQGGPYYLAWVDHEGRRRVRSAKTRDRRTADRILADIERRVALRRDGIITTADEDKAAADRVPLGQLVTAYLDWCERAANQNPKAVGEKRRHLNAMLAGIRARRLSELTADRITAHLVDLASTGRAARTVNFRRQSISAFMGWCRRTGRTDRNPMPAVPRQDEQRDRRRVRRSLTESEVARLFEVAQDRGRWLWYALALYAGLRRGDLVRLRWRDIDIENRILTIADGKARRVDRLPIHDELIEPLKAARPLSITRTDARVFLTAPTDRTRQRDYERAGIPLVDDEGRVADLHALRATLGTMLARAGVAPQVAQRLLRHSDYRTTLRHYTVLGLADTAAAIKRVNIGTGASASARADARAGGTS